MDDDNDVVDSTSLVLRDKLPLRRIRWLLDLPFFTGEVVLVLPVLARFGDPGGDLLLLRSLGEDDLDVVEAVVLDEDVDDVGVGAVIVIPSSPEVPPLVCRLCCFSLNARFSFEPRDEGDRGDGLNDA